MELSISERKELADRFFNHMLFTQNLEGQWVLIQPGCEGDTEDIEMVVIDLNDFPPGEDWTEEEIKLENFGKVYTWKYHV